MFQFRLQVHSITLSSKANFNCSMDAESNITKLKHLFGWIKG